MRQPALGVTSRALRLSTASFCLLAAAACRSEAPPSAEFATSTQGLVTTVDGVWFYGPLSTAPVPTSGPFDATLLERLRVVFEWTEVNGTAHALASFDAHTTPAITLDGPHQYYLVNVPAAPYMTDPSRTYRLRVLLDAAELGRADAPAQIFTVLTYNPGFTIGVRFRIDRRPVPVLTSIAPPVVTSGASGATLTLTGSSFVGDSVIHLDGQSYATRAGSNGTRLVDLPAGALATPGARPLTVFTPAPGGGESAAVTLTIQSDRPALTSLDPSAAALGSTDTIVTIHGAGFVSGARASLGATPLATTFVSASELTATLVAHELATAGTFDVTVANPAPTVGPSASLPFTVAIFAPTLTSIAQASTFAGTGGLTISLAGANFHADALATFGGVPLQTTWIDATSLTAELTDAMVAAEGAYAIAVSNPGLLGGLSGSVTFEVLPLQRVARTMTGGDAHSCVIHADRTVWCAGLNMEAELGDGSQIDRVTFAPVVGLTGAVQLAAGAFHTCAILTDGTARCWGDNTGGALGDPSLHGAYVGLTARVVEGLTDLVDISGGDHRTCAVRADGTVWCWGLNTRNALGPYWGASALDPPAQVSGISDAVQVTTHGWYHTCALRRDGHVWCWGANGTLGTPIGSGADQPAPTEVPGLAHVAAIAAGERGTCALRTDGTVWCWGDLTSTFAASTAPAQVPNLGPAMMISAGSGFACALERAGTVACWGSGGELGDGTVASSSTPVHVLGLDGVTALAAGRYHTLAGRADGSFAAWGDNGRGQLGDGTMTRALAPVAADLTSEVVVPYLAEVRPVWLVAGADAVLTLQGSCFDPTAVVRLDGVELAATWMSGVELQAPASGSMLSYGSHTVTVENPGPNGGTATRSIYADTPYPHLFSISPASAPAGSADLVLTATGWDFVPSSVVRFAGTNLATTWISSTELRATVPAASLAAVGTYGVTVHTPAPGGGTSSTVNFTCTDPLPVLTSVTPGQTYAGLAARTITLDGASFSTGAYATFAGARLTTTRVSSTQLTATVPAASIAFAGDYPVTVVTTAGASAPQSFHVGTLVPPTRTIAVSYAHGCVVHADRTLWCLGDNTYGELGTGTMGGSAGAPTYAPELDDVVQVAAGSGGHTCVLLGDRTVRCFGENYYGQLGDNSYADRASPGVVAGLTNVEELALGSAHSCARTRDRTVWCWGNNGYGEVGDGSWLWYATQRTPQQALVSNAVQISSGGGSHTCALLGSGTVRCWGRGDSGQLGIAYPSAYGPIDVPGLSDVVQIATGTSHTCALLGDGRVLCWGMLGPWLGFDGWATQPVAGLGRVAGLSSGGSVTCARLEDGSAQCWGANGYGQLGDGSTTDRSTPRTVTGIQGIADLVVGDQASVAYLTDGTYRTWGRDLVTRASHLTPTAIDLGANALQPDLTMLTPATLLAGSPTTVITVTGTSFLSGATVDLDGAPLATTFVSHVRLTASVSSTVLASAGDHDITVTNPAPAAVRSTGRLGLLVQNARPTLASVSPGTLPLGARATLTLTGAAFAPGATVLFDGAALPTTWVSSTRLEALLPATQLATPGTFDVSVANPAPAVGPSDALPFTVEDRGPVLTGLAPSAATAGDAALVLTLSGAGFRAGASVSLGGVALETTFVSDTELRASVLAASLSRAGDLLVVVTNPAPSSTASPPITFTVANPIPALAGLSPTSVPAGSADARLTLSGASFAIGASVLMDGASLATSFVSSTELTAVVPSGLLAAPGVHAVAVENPAPSLGSSTSLLFAVGDVPVLSALTPARVPAGGPSFELTLTGSRFDAATEVTVGGTPVLATFVSDGELVAFVPATAIAEAGAHAVRATSPMISASSNPLELTAELPTPELSALTPSSGSLADAPLALTITGSGFLAGATVDFAGTDVVATFVSDTRLVAELPAALLGSPGPKAIRVSNPAPSGGPSLPIAFTCLDARPVLTAISPHGTFVDVDRRALTLTGSNFLEGAHATFDGQSLAATYVSATELHATIPRSAISSPGSYPVAVVNPGGLASASQSFTVRPLTRRTPDLSVGVDYHTCIIQPDRTVACVGVSLHDPFSSALPVTISNTLQTVGYLSNAVQVSVGSFHACAVIGDGTVRCWGANDVGQLGDGTTRSSLFPVTVLGLSGVEEVAASSQFSCARKADGTVWCWGGNWDSVLGDGTTTPHAAPVRVGGLTGAVQVAAMSNAVCALLRDATVRCWGANFYGQLGTGDTTPRTAPTAVPSLSNVAALAAGLRHFCALTADGTVSCWGVVDENNGPMVTRSTPTAVAGLGEATQLEAGYGGRTCAILADGTAACWGWGVLGAPGETLVAAPVPGLEHVVGIGVGGSVIAQLSDGTYRGWGNNTYGELGDGTFVSRAPVAPALLPATPVVPSLAALSPALTLVGSGELALTLTGSSFQIGATARVGSTSLATDFVDTTRLTTRVPAALFGAAGSLDVVVTNPAPGSRSSAARTLTVANPTPVLTALAPATGVDDDRDLQLTVLGTSFVPGAQVTFDGANVATTFVSSSELTAIVPGAARSALGAHAVAATNAAPSLGPSAPLSFSVGALLRLTGLSPARAVARRGDLELTVLGRHFEPGSSVLVDGSPVVTSFVSTEELIALIPAAALEVAGALEVAVMSPLSDLSAPLDLGVDNPAPALSALTPARGVLGSGLVLTVEGADFAAGAAVSFDGLGVATTFVSTSEVLAEIPAAALASAGTKRVSVTNPAPTVGPSEALVFTCENPSPVLVAVSPSRLVVGSEPLEVTLSGSGFAAGADVVSDLWTGTVRYGSAAELVVTVQAPPGTSPGAYAIAVRNPAPGGGTSEPRFFTVVESNRAVELSAGGAHSCVLDGAGDVWCVGDNGHGEVLPSSRAAQPYLTRAGLGEPSSQVSAGSGHSCAVTTRGRVACWGANAEGQLGDGTLEDPGAPRFVEGLSSALEVSAGAAHTCARTSTGLYCWGANLDGQVGDGSPDARVLVPRPVPLTGVGRISARGDGHTCATASGGTVWCWGANDRGQLGTGDVVPRRQPTQVPGLVHAVAVDTRDRHTCALLTDGTVSCWGANDWGQLGTGDTLDRLAPTAVVALTDVVQLGAGESFTCALRADQTLWCWGLDADGTLGSGTVAAGSSTEPRAVHGAGPVALLATGGHTLLALADGTYRGFGPNAHGQLGDDTTSSRGAPIRALFALSGLAPASLVAGEATDLVVSGWSFERGAVVELGGIPLETRFGSAGGLVATVPPSPAGDYAVTVSIPAPDGAETRPLTLRVDNPAVTAAAVSPSPLAARAEDALLTVSGSGLVAGATATFDGTPLAATVLSSTTLTAILPAALQVGGHHRLEIANAAPALGSPAVLGLDVYGPPPSLAALRPEAVTAGGGDFTLSLDGGPFDVGDQVVFGARTLAASRVSATDLTVTVPAEAITASGYVEVTVLGRWSLEPSTARTFAVDSPTPTLSTLMPVAMLAGGPGATLTVVGALFEPGAEVRLEGTPLATSFVSATQLTATVPAGLLASEGSRSVTVSNPSPTDGPSAALSLDVVTAPRSTAISPASAVARTSAFSLTVTGQSFPRDATIRFGGATLGTTFVSNRELRADVPASLITMPGTIPVSVTSTSVPVDGAIDFVCASPRPVLWSISPTRAPAAGRDVTVTMNGTGFVGGSRVELDGAAIATTYVGPGTLTAVVPAISAALVESHQLAVVSDGPGGGRSTEQVFSAEAITVAVGSFHACALHADGTVWCVGRNDYGQLGDGTTTNRASAVQVPGLADVTQLSAGGDHTCALAADGTVRCWGDGGWGQLGDGSTTNRSTPVAVVGLDHAVQIATGELHTCARKGDGTLWCWGSNVAGYLGDGTTTSHSTPVQVAGISAAVHVAVGTFHSCAVLRDRTARCWGSNTNGGLGTGDQTFRSTPTDVQGLTGVRSLAVGYGHTCAVLSNGTVQCWGRNTEGQLGDGTTQLRTVPGAVPGLTDVASLGTGMQGFHTCVVLTDGTARCFGNNSAGELGDGTTTRRLQPVAVTGLANARLIAVGGHRSIAETSSLTHFAWGWNLYGELGDGTTITRYAPVRATQLDSTSARPTLASLSPAGLGAGAPDTTLTIDGSGFDRGAVASLAGASVPTTFVSTTRLTASLPAGLLTSEGTYPVVVTNPAPTQGSSAPLSLTVYAPTPILSALSPSQALTGAGGTAVTLAGSGFASGAAVHFAGTALATTFVSSTSLTAVVPAELFATAGTFAVDVTNPGSLPSGAQTFTVQNPAPVVASYTPTSVAAGADAFTLTVLGSAFVSGAQVTLGGTSLVTTVVSATELRATVPAAAIAAPGYLPLVVSSPAPSVGPSATRTVGVSSPTPFLASVSPTSVALGAAATLTIDGTSFFAGTALSFDGVDVPTVFVSSTRLTAQVPAGLAAPMGDHAVAVTNPAPTAGPSAPVVVAVVNPTPVPTALLPASVDFGSSDLTLTVAGTGFVSGAVVFFGASPLATTFVSAAELRAAVPASSLASPATVQVSVVNPPPNAGAGPSATFDVTNPTPVIASLSPASSLSGVTELVVTLTGAGFLPESQVRFDATPLAAMRVSDTQLTVILTSALLAFPGAHAVTVVNPAPGGGTSAAATFTVSTTRLILPVTLQPSVETCAIASNGTVRCAGEGVTGGLGNGANVRSTTPVTVSNLTNAAEIGAGGYFGCALLQTGEVRCWGQNNNGQLGNGTTTNTNVPVSTGILNAQEISVGTQAFFGCARLADSTVRCWGQNVYGQLGNGTTTNASSPVAVTGLTNVAQVSVGIEHACALLSNGTVRCWGRNTYGQLGDGTTTTQVTPVQVAGVTGASLLSAGGYHTCVLLTNGAVQCWGRSSNGQVGNGATADRVASPTSVAGLAAATQISAGTFSTCAILTDGTARCWGANTAGQLGDGTTTQRTSPVAVTGLSNLLEIRVGGVNTACARTTSGASYCWGNNANGQLGDGTTTNRLTPIAVPF